MATSIGWSPFLPAQAHPKGLLWEESTFLRQPFPGLASRRATSDHQADLAVWTGLADAARDYVITAIVTYRVIGKATEFAMTVHIGEHLMFRT